MSSNRPPDAEGQNGAPAHGVDRFVSAGDLCMLRAVMKSLRQRRGDYCKAIGEHNVAALVVRLFLVGHCREQELRALLDVEETDRRPLR